MSKPSDMNEAQFVQYKHCIVEQCYAALVESMCKYVPEELRKMDKMSRDLEILSEKERGK